MNDATDNRFTYWRAEVSRLEMEKAKLYSALKLLIEEICDVEGREGMTDADFAEQVIALAQSQRAALKPAHGGHNAP